MTPVSVSASWDPERTWLYRGFLDDLDMKQTLFALLVIASATPSAMAQKEIPKAPGHEQCPLGYVNTLGTTCVSPHLLRGSTDEWQSLPVGLDEYRRWLLQEENTRDFLNRSPLSACTVQV